MSAAKVLSVDASALSSVDFNSYIATFFATLAKQSTLFYGGTPDIAYGSAYNVSGSQVLNTYTEDGAASDQVVLIEGADIAYDFMHYGSSYGHGISGEVDTLVFGTWVEGVTTGTEGIGAEGEVTGLEAGLVIDGLDLSAAAGSGSDVTTNDVYGVYKAMQNLDAEYLYDLFAEYAIEFTGTSGDDSVQGYAHADVLMGGAGDDQLSGGAGRDVLIGGAGDDTLFGNAGADELRGGTGDDRLSGGLGRDVLYGGSGADTFVIRKVGTVTDIDIIADFDIAEDVLSLRQFGLSGLDAVTVTETEDYLDLTFGAQTVRLEGLTAADLDAATLLF